MKTPDVRGWATIGMFALVAYVLTLTALVPNLRQDDLWKTICTLLLGSGAFGLVCAFLWGGSKATTAAIDTVNEMAKSPQGISKDVQQVVVTNDSDQAVPVKADNPDDVK